MNVNLLWETSQSTNWKLALASVRNLKISSQHLLHIHGTFQAPNSGFTSFTEAKVCKARHPRLLFFTISCLDVHTLLPPHNMLTKKNHTSHTVYWKYQSTECIIQHVLCVRPNIPKAGARCVVLNFSIRPLFWSLNYVRQAFHLFRSAWGNMNRHVNSVLGKLRFYNWSCDTKPTSMAAPAKRLCSYSVRMLHHAVGCLEGHDDAKVWKSCNKGAQVEQLDCSFSEVIKRVEWTKIIWRDSDRNTSTATC